MYSAPYIAEELSPTLQKLLIYKLLAQPNSVEIKGRGKWASGMRLTRQGNYKLKSNDRKNPRITMWLKESNRDKHFVYGALIAVVFTILAVIGAAFALEYKDKLYGNKFDWLDIVATILGGVIGQIIQLFIIVLFCYIK